AARAHFGWLGGTPGAIVSQALSSPGRVLAHVASGWPYVVALLAPLAFLPLAAPRRLLPALPTIGLNLLSALPDPTRIIDCHYSALAAPGLIAAALFGAARVSRWIRPAGARVLLIAGAGVGTALWGAMPGMRGFHGELYVLDDRAASLDAI